MEAESNQGINKLAKTISKRVKDQAYKPPDLDFGIIKKNGGLITNTFPKTIMKGDYSVLNGIALNSGSLVLVAWVDSEAVVIGTVDK